MFGKVKAKLNDLAWKAWETIENPKVARTVGLSVMAGACTLLAAQAVYAITAPAAGSFAYDVYDVAINKMLNGPIGFVAGVAGMAIGAIMAIQQKIMLAVPAILGGAVLVNADTLLTSLGLVF